MDTYTSQASALQRLEEMIPIFQSRMGAMLFLISALLSRGLVCLSAWSSLLKYKSTGCFSQSLTSFCDCVMCVPRTGAELKIIFNEIQTIYFCPCAHLHTCLKSVRKNFMICEIGLN